MSSLFDSMEDVKTELGMNSSDVVPTNVVVAKVPSSKKKRHPDEEDYPIKTYPNHSTLYHERYPGRDWDTDLAENDQNPDIIKCKEDFMVHFVKWQSDVKKWENDHPTRFTARKLRMKTERAEKKKKKKCDDDEEEDEIVKNGKTGDVVARKRTVEKAGLEKRVKDGADGESVGLDTLYKKIRKNNMEVEMFVLDLMGKHDTVIV